MYDKIIFVCISIKTGLLESVLPAVGLSTLLWLFSHESHTSWYPRIMIPSMPPQPIVKPKLLMTEIVTKSWISVLFILQVFEMGVFWSVGLLTSGIFLFILRQLFLVWICEAFLLLLSLVLTYGRSFEQSVAFLVPSVQWIFLPSVLCGPFVYFVVMKLL